MSSVLIDTHTLLWHLFDTKKLSAVARTALKDADDDPALNIFLSEISLIEIVYLVEKGKLAVAIWPNTLSVLADPTTSFKTLDITRDISTSIEKIPRATVPDMPDRIIAATSLVHSLPVVTRDRQIQQAPIQTIW